MLSIQSSTIETIQAVVEKLKELNRLNGTKFDVGDSLNAKNTIESLKLLKKNWNNFDWDGDKFHGQPSRENIIRNDGEFKIE